MSKARWAAGTIVVTGGVVLAVLYFRGDEAARAPPAAPPTDLRAESARGQALARRTKPTPVTPELDVTAASEAYARAVAAGSDAPGAAAFRATTDAYFEYNLELAKQQAAAEGLTLEQVKELTYFGLVVMRARQWGDVEDVLGHELTDDQRAAGDKLVEAAHLDYKETIRASVAAGDDPAARDALIQDTEGRFFAEYYEITGLAAGQFDDLLAGDVTGTKKYAPAGTNPDPSALPPQVITPPHSRDDR
jgi:hypothetical protein